jgi:hypothetical protein
VSARERTLYSTLPKVGGQWSLRNATASRGRQGSSSCVSELAGIRCQPGCWPCRLVLLWVVAFPVADAGVVYEVRPRHLPESFQFIIYWVYHWTLWATDLFSQVMLTVGGRGGEGCWATILTLSFGAGRVAALSAVHAGRSLTPWKFHGTHLCYRLSGPQGYWMRTGLGKLKISKDPIWNRIQDLPHVVWRSASTNCATSRPAELLIASLNILQMRGMVERVYIYLNWDKELQRIGLRTCEFHKRRKLPGERLLGFEQDLSMGNVHSKCTRQCIEIVTLDTA